ncbi:pre-mRNA 3'-end-processing factor FIP1-like isoform X1 [Hibiscus syriacus]|nr:pre-mRNA 3'-end-processing factor FIP1-like isoform X1 [Hibiscus syriacus]XP_039039878.1 pre-mRNA 3'-end-processing factor FIP1-like isoform X1 [Hibiscus syriacus]
MWRVRQKELELNDRLKGRSKNDTRHRKSPGDSCSSSRMTSEKHDSDFSASCSSSKRMTESSYSREDGGLRDEEIEQFLQSRVKRGRGSIGSRMDETGPYLPANFDSPKMASTNFVARDHRVTLGLGKPSSLRWDESSDGEHRWKKEKELSKSSDKKHRRKHRSKEKPKDKKKKRKEEKRSKHGK